MRTIVWFRAFDLRLGDHEPLHAALEGEDIIPLFVFDDGVLPLQSAHRMQFLLECVESLAADLESKGSRLVVLRDGAAELLPRLLHDWEADRIVAHAGAEPADRAREARLKKALGPRVEFFQTNMLAAYGSIRTKQEKPFSVYTYFARAFRATTEVGPAVAAPRRLPALPRIDVGAAITMPTLGELGYTRRDSLPRGGEHSAWKRLKAFVESRLDRYGSDRDRMDLEGTSRLSADLRFGALSARQVWNAVSDRAANTQSTRTFLDQLLWREFAYSTIVDRPQLLQHPFRPEFEGFPWREDESGWTAWAEGRTGYPVIDAAARQLLGEGFVHNRARMASASFLTKHLMLGYWQGEQHYMKYLVDGDLAQNNLGWQWSAGCGCDAQPYFRVFHPVTQGTKFDPDGAYVRRWVPELASMPSKFIHRPWEAPEAVVRDAGVTLDENYPAPIVDHKVARERFLSTAKAHLQSMRGSAS